MTSQKLRLPRLPVNWQDQPGLFERYWDESQSSIEKALNQLLTLPLIEDALVTLDTTIAAAESAIADANVAIADTTAAATALKEKESLASSYPSGFTPPLIVADSLGNITVANHQRVYGDPALNPTVAVTGAAIATGATPGSYLRIYYNDAARAGGAVSFYTTTDPTPPIAQQGDVHSVGAVEIPVVGSSDGSRLGPPGFVYL